jgi:all-trans-retinol 13,14-reductase
MHKHDVVIIGSGISALTAAAVLSKKGKSVVVLEQYRKPGGYLHSFDRFGLTFDTGSHYVGSLSPGEPFHTMLSYLGVYNDDIFLPLNKDGFDVFRYPDYEVALCTGVEAAINRVAEHFPNDRAAIEKYYRLCESTANMFPTYRFTDVDEPAEIIKAIGISLESVVQSLTSNPKLQSFFYGYCTLHAVSPKHTPFGFHAIMTDSLLKGPYGFRDGGDLLAQSYIKVIEGAGGKVITRQRVAKLEIENQSVSKVVTAKGEEFLGDWVISCLHPKQLLRLIDSAHLKPAYQKRIADLQESMGFFGLYGACKERPPLDADRNYFLISTNDPEEYHSYISNQHLDFDAKPVAVYMARNSRTETPSTKGLTPLTIHAPGPISWFSDFRDSRFAKRPEAYHKRKNALAENILNHLDSYWAGLKHTVGEYETSTPLSNLYYNGSEDGSAYGIYHSIENTGMRSLGPRTHVRNLLLTGQNTIFPGLMASAISGLRTAGHIIGVKSVMKELKLLGASQ